MAFKEKLAVGNRVRFDGESHTVTGFTRGTIQLRSERGQITHMDLSALLAYPDFRMLDVQNDTPENTTFPDNIPEPQLQEAQKKLEHIQEAVTGYRSGHAATALPGEPKTEYAPNLTTLRQRMETKAAELGITARSLWIQKKNYERHGIWGLADQRKLQNLDPFKNVDSRIREGIGEVLDDLTNASNITKKQISRRVERYLKQRYPAEDIRLPYRATFNRMVDELSRGRNTFGSAKARRSIANRPATPYRRFKVSRPGEAILMDVYSFDSYAMGPLSFEWLPIQLALALDLYSRSMVAWRFLPVSTNAVDAALLLYDMLIPKPMRPGWPATARWPYTGVPENIVIEIAGEGKAENGIAGIPFVHPETVFIDRGKPFISQAFKDVCARLGTNIQLARPYTPTDKSQIERVFRIIRETFVENLPGYKGPDIFSRGLNVEKQAFLFIDEIAEYFARWVATYWQPRHHRGLDLPQAPHLNLSPNDMYEEGIARAGFVYTVPDPNLYYELLPTYWRTIQHYGVSIDGLIYDGEILNDFRNTTSPYNGMNAGKWPFRCHPGDHSRVFFYDHTLNQWHTLSWISAQGPERPFNDATLGFVKSQVLARGGNPNNRDELDQALNDYLNEIDDNVLAKRDQRRRAAVHVIRSAQALQDHQKGGPTAGQPIFAPDEDASPDFRNGSISGPHTLDEPDDDQDGHNDLREITVLRTVDEAIEDDDFEF